MNEELLFHLKIPKSFTAKYAILPGDPGRVPKIAAFLDNPQQLAQNREYNSYFGFIGGEKVVVTSTGIGGPSAAIAVEELNMLGVDTIVRIGTCGGMQDFVKAGDAVIATSAVRMEGTSLQYAPIEMPAAADFTLTCLLAESAKELNAPYHVGTVQSKDSFYGQHSPQSMPVSYELKNKWDALIKCGVLASEMETAAIFTVSAVRKIKAASVLTAIWNQENSDGYSAPSFDTTAAVKIAVNALKKQILCNSQKK